MALGSLGFSVLVDPGSDRPGGGMGPAGPGSPMLGSSKSDGRGVVFHNNRPSEFIGPPDPAGPQVADLLAGRRKTQVSVGLPSCLRRLVPLNSQPRFSRSWRNF